MNYITYTADGTILRTGYCPDGALHLMGDPLQEEYVIEGTANDEDQEVVDFTVITKRVPTPKPELTTVEQRRTAYPPVGEYLDAQVKMASGDPSLITEGQEQFMVYVAKCLAVKTEYPEE